MIDIASYVFFLYFIVYINLFFYFIAGVRRLRRRASDPKYPEMKALERIFNELRQSDSLQGDVLI